MGFFLDAGVFLGCPDGVFGMSPPDVVYVGVLWGFWGFMWF